MTRHAIPSLPHIISKVSTWAVPATRPMEPSLRTKSCQKPSILSAQAAGSGSPPRPRSSFFALFLEAFSDPRVYRYPSHLCSEVFFFAASTKMCSKAPIGYAAWGLPQGSTFACTVTTINKTKKLKLKKMEPNCSIVVTAFSLRFHSVRQIVLLW